MRIDRLYSCERGGIVGTFFLILIAAGVIFFIPEYTLGLFSAALIVDDEPQPSDAIVVLLNPAAPERTLKAYELFSAGLSPRIVLASGADQRLAMSEPPPEEFRWPLSSEANILGLESLGVPPHDIVLVSAKHIYDTATELAAIATYMRAKGWQSAILVTSESHTRRVDLIWQRVAPDIFHHTVAAPQRNFRRWWHDGKARKALLYEYAALLKEGFAQLGPFTKRIFQQAGEREPVG